MRFARSLFQTAVLIFGAPVAWPQGVQQAPQELPWRSLLSEPSAGVNLQFRIEWTGKGWQIEFKNLGTGSIHFSCALDRFEDEAQETSLPRIHVEPRKGAAAFIRVVTDAQPPEPTPVLRHIRLDSDEGAFWRE